MVTEKFSRYNKITFKSRYVIVTPFNEGLNIAKNIKDNERRIQLKQLVLEELDYIPYGMIMRSSCASANKSEIIKDCKNTIMTAQNVLSAEDKQMGLIHRALLLINWHGGSGLTCLL